MWWRMNYKLQQRKVTNTRRMWYHFSKANSSRDTEWKSISANSWMSQRSSFTQGRTSSLKCLERRQLLARQKELERQVRSFLERDDNSRMNPGKQDCLTVDGEKVQTRILNDYLYILYEKFIAENPQVKKSKSSFYKLRPKHIRHSNSLKPNNCLC